MASTENSPDGRSALWADIAPKISLAASSLQNFRSESGVNSRLAHWAPAEPSLRWFKSFVQLAAATMPGREIKILQMLGDTNLGEPVTATIEFPHTESMSTSERQYFEVNLDYLYAAEETAFIETALEIESISTVVELGGGFGRTAHTALQTHPTISQYVIVDLSETLNLSSKYLKQVLPEKDFAKLKFMTPEAMAVTDYTFDLLIQIDGFQEMDSEVIDIYYANLIPRCTWLYVSNPVGKYLPETAGLSGASPELIETVMTLGRSQLLVDPWDEKTLEPARSKHVDAYHPDGFRLLTSRPSRLRSFYQNVIYESTRI